MSIFERFELYNQGRDQKTFSTTNRHQTHIWTIRIRMFHFKNLQNVDFENPGYGPNWTCYVTALLRIFSKIF